MTVSLPGAAGAPVGGPTVLRILLGAHLRRMRERAGISREDAGYHIRASGSKIPIVVLSSRNDERGKVAALELGADDYVSKPFGMAELVARLRTSLRHRLQEQGSEPVFRSGDLVIDLTRRRVHALGAEVKLSNKEWEILRLLAYMRN